MTQRFQWNRSAAFSERVDRLELHGLHFQHVNLCERRAWMYLHRVNFAQWNSRVATGAAQQATHYKRDRSTVGLFGLAPDRVDWDQAIVFENKGTGGASGAVDRQVGFYALMLSLATGRNWTGRGASTHQSALARGVAGRRAARRALGRQPEAGAVVLQRTRPRRAPDWTLRQLLAGSFLWT